MTQITRMLAHKRARMSSDDSKGAEIDRERPESSAVNDLGQVTTP
jgi:hypothetical protein